MTKRRKILLAFASVLILGVFLWAIFTPKPEPDLEPSYKGKPLSFWVTQHYSQYGQILAKNISADSAEPVIAIRHIGTNALPYLLKWISYEPPPKWRIKLSAYFNSTMKRPATRDQGNDLWAGSIYAFKALGTNARPVVPLLIKSLQDKRELVVAESAAALGEVAIEPHLVIPALINSMQRSNSVFRCVSAEALRHFRGQALPAVPALLNALKDPDPNVRFTAESALKAIDPEALKRATRGVSP